MFITAFTIARHQSTLSLPASQHELPIYGDPAVGFCKKKKPASLLNVLFSDADSC